MPVTIGRLAHAGAPVSSVDEVQTNVLTGMPTGGTFTITFDGAETDEIDATASAVLAALETLETGDVLCTGGPLPGPSRGYRCPRSRRWTYDD